MPEGDPKQKIKEFIDDEIKNYTNLSKQQGESLHKIGVAAVEEELSRAPETAKTPEVAATAPTEEVKGTERTERTAGGTSAPKIELTKEDRETHFDYVGRNAESSAEATPNHNIFGRFGARLERFGIKLVNAPQKIALETMYDWRSERAAEAEGKFEERKKELAVAEAELTKLDESIAKAKTLGEFDTKLATKIERDCARFMHNIEKAKTRLNSAHVSLEHYNGQKVGWENKQKNLAEKIVGQIDQKLQPSREMFADLIGKNEQLTKDIDRLKQLKTTGQSGLTELRAKLKNNPSAAEKADIRTKLTAVEELLGRIDNEYNTYTKEQSRIGAKMNRANLYIGQWDVMRNEQLRTTTKDRRYFNPGEQTQAELGANREHMFSHAPEVGEQEVAAVPHSNTGPDAQPKTDNDNVPGSAQKQSDIPEPPTPGGASAAAATEQNPQEKVEESTLQPDFRQQNKIIKAIESGNFDVLNQTLAGISAEERESFFNKLTSGELKDEQLDELIKNIGFPFSTKEGLQKMQEQIANDNELKNSFNEIIRNYLYPKGVYREGYTASRDEIAKFLQDMPTPRAFDATFIDGRVENIKRAIETETQPGRKETLKAELEFRLTQQKRTYPKVKAFLYGKRAEYWNQIQLLKKQAA